MNESVCTRKRAQLTLCKTYKMTCVFWRLSWDYAVRVVWSASLLRKLGFLTRIERLTWTLTRLHRGAGWSSFSLGLRNLLLACGPQPTSPLLKSMVGERRIVSMFFQGFNFSATTSDWIFYYNSNMYIKNCYWLIWINYIFEVCNIYLKIKQLICITGQWPKLKYIRPGHAILLLETINYNSKDS